MSYFYRPSLITVSSAAYAGGADLILSDHGRSELEIDMQRIEKRERMANGRMRSKFVAEKKAFNTNWEMLPSRSEYTADKYASAIDMVNFYNAVTGEFTIKIYGDTDVGGSLSSQQLYGTFSVFFTEFSSSIVKRGKDFDFWNVRFGVEEA